MEGLCNFVACGRFVACVGAIAPLLPHPAGFAQVLHLLYHVAIMIMDRLSYLNRSLVTKLLTQVLSVSYVHYKVFYASPITKGDAAGSTCVVLCICEEVVMTPPTLWHRNAFLSVQVFRRWRTHH